MRRCKICGGTGIIYDRNIEAGSHGELKVCECIEKKCKCGAVPPYQVFNKEMKHSWCACRTARLRLEATKKVFKNSCIPRKYMWKFHEDFEIVNEIAEKLINTATSIREDIRKRHSIKGYYLWGSTGGGKTLLACIILQELMLKYALGGRFVDISRQFFQRLRRSYDSTDEAYGTGGRILDELIEVPFLVIDDFGTQRNTEWESEMLYNLLDSRYEQERLTIMTSNLHISKFKDVAHGRIYSRIKEMCEIINVNLPDYRDKFHREHKFV